MAKMKEVNNKYELPKWFDINNYKKLKPLTETELITVFRTRWWWLRFCSEENGFTGYELDKNIHWAKVKGGHVESSEKEVIYFKESVNYKGCLGGDIVTGLELENVLFSLECMIKRKFIKLNTEVRDMDDYSKRMFNHKFGGSDFNMTFKDIGFMWNKDRVWLDMNLANYTDRELSRAVELFLPVWRKQMEIPEPKIKISTPRQIEKLLEYQIIPWMDLKLWEAETKSHIKTSVIAGALFPDHDIGSEELVGKGKIIEFFKTITDQKFRWENELEAFKEINT